MRSRPALVVIAKEPRPGRAKTRLCPPCTPTEAAALAEAALADTLAAVAGADCGHGILALDGIPGAWLPPGFEVIPQARGTLDARLAAVVESVGGPALVIGMDTPQLTATLLSDSAEELLKPGADAVLGPASDGGYWGIGLRTGRGEAIAGVPMSVPWTAHAQRARFGALGLRWRELPELRDVDEYDDAAAVASICPGTRFALRLREIQAGWRESAVRSGVA